MIRLLLLFSFILTTISFKQRPISKNIYSIYADKTKDVFDKFEYASRIGHKVMQEAYLKEIHELLKKKRLKQEGSEKKD
jgi:hypothetical protein